MFPSHDQINNVFQDEHPEDALEVVIDGNLRGIYPFEHVYKVCKILDKTINIDTGSLVQIKINK